MVQLGAAIGRELKTLGRTTPAVMLPGRSGMCDGVTGIDECIQVPTHARGRQAEPFADLTCGDGPRFEEQANHRRPGLPLGGCGRSSVQRRRCRGGSPC
ncbi:Uncharacterised protein [Mycobacteroides abscessus subsp. abscessus]|nr:Uncharacterised protein [Mycobacteroides abscessus subsp. abscessus]